MTEKSSLTASAVASKLDANVNFIQGPCRAAGINASKAQCIPPAQLVVLICNGGLRAAAWRLQMDLMDPMDQMDKAVRHCIPCGSCKTLQIVAFLSIRPRFCKRK